MWHVLSNLWRNLHGGIEIDRKRSVELLKLGVGQKIFFRRRKMTYPS